VCHYCTSKRIVQHRAEQLCPSATCTIFLHGACSFGTHFSRGLIGLGRERSQELLSIIGATIFGIFLPICLNSAGILQAVFQTLVGGVLSTRRRIVFQSVLSTILGKLLDSCDRFFGDVRGRFNLKLVGLEQQAFVFLAFVFIEENRRFPAGGFHTGVREPLGRFRQKPESS